MLLSRWFYYLSSIPTLLLGINNWLTVAALFLGLPVQKPVVIELKNGCRFKVRSPMDVWVIKETCLDRDYERVSVNIVDGWTVLDIGAGLGDFAISIAREHKYSTVYAYEPFPDSFALLQENIALNQIHNVRAFLLAIGAKSGLMYLHTGSREAVRHSTSTIDLNANTIHANTIQVPGVTLDQVFEELGLGLQRCDFLKVDCEGAEYDIFFHVSRETLCKIKHVCLEYHDGVTSYSHADLARFFKDKGFHVEIHPNPAHHQIGFLYASNPNL